MRKTKTTPPNHVMISPPLPLLMTYLQHAAQLPSVTDAAAIGMAMALTAIGVPIPVCPPRNPRTAKATLASQRARAARRVSTSTTFHPSPTTSTQFIELTPAMSPWAW